MCSIITDISVVAEGSSRLGQEIDENDADYVVRQPIVEMNVYS